MSIIYRNTFRDRLAFNAFSIPRKRFFQIYVILFLGFMTYEDVIRVWPKNRTTAFQIGYVVFVEVILFFLIFAIFAVVVVLVNISKMNKTLMAERTVTLAEECFTGESMYGRTEYKWPIVQKLARTRRHIFIYTAADRALIIPRRAFENRAAWDQFYDFCLRKIGKTSGTVPHA